MTPPVRYKAASLRELFLKQRIATLEELKETLGTDTDLTVLRKLKELDYRTSYSHRGKYYTLEEIARFDELGLWSFDTVHFSRHGTLLRTIEFLVETSEAGHFGDELECILKVETKDALLKLYEQNRLHREKVGTKWLYCSIDAYQRQKQLKCREEEQELDKDVFPDELKAAIILFFSLLDEKKRRLYAGLEALKWGYGGDRKVAILLGLDEKTVARGRRELLTGELDHDGVRKSGGGRRPLKKGLQK